MVGVVLVVSEVYAGKYDVRAVRVWRTRRQRGLWADPHPVRRGSGGGGSNRAKTMP